jgi:cyanophycinase
MVMCEYYFDPKKQRVERGLNLVPNACVLPHHNTFGKGWAGELRKMLPKVLLIGIDERTGMLSTDSVTDSRTITDVEWQVYGGGGVTLYRGESTVSYGRGESFHLK